jgi:hypothetical protein
MRRRRRGIGRHRVIPTLQYDTNHTLPAGKLATSRQTEGQVRVLSGPSFHTAILDPSESSCSDSGHERIIAPRAKSMTAKECRNSAIKASKAAAKARTRKAKERKAQSG